MKRFLYISRPPSGINLYPCKEIADFFAGQKVTVEFADGKGFLKAGGRYSISKTTTLGPRPWRLFIGAPEHVPGGLDVPLMGVTIVNWRWVNHDHAIEFDLPTEFEPPKVLKRGPMPKKSNDPFDKLRETIAQLNELVNDPQFKDVQYVVSHCGEDGDTEWIELKPPFKVQGRIVRVEEFE